MKIVLKKREIATFFVCFSSLLPLFNFFPTFTIEALTMGFAALYLFLPSLKVLNKTKAFVVVVFWFIWFLLSVNSVSVFRISYYASLYIFMIFSYSFVNGSNTLRVMCNLIKIAGFISCLATILFWISKDLYVFYTNFMYDNAYELIISYENGNFAGLYNHYSKNGMILSVAIGAYFVDFIRAEKTADKYKNTFFIFLMTLALLSTGKRGPIIFSLFSIFVVYILNLGKSFSWKKLLKTVATIICAVLLLLVIIDFIPQTGRFIERFKEAEESGDVTVGRSILYAQAMQLFKSNPLFGNGWFSFTTLVENSGGGAHNIYLQLLCEVGLIGTAFFVFVFTYFLTNTIKLLRRLKFFHDIKTIESKNYLLVSVYIQLFFILYGLTGNPLYDRMMLCPYFISLSIYIFYRYNINSILRKG